jgi:DNA-directed RNA polymerase specialized sigma24 family protein
MAPRTNTHSIDANGLAHLLGRLDPDADRAAQEYEHLHRALVKFFDWRGASPPDECADEAIDRLARRLQDNVTVEDVRNYAHGIARMILLERRRASVWTSLDADSAAVSATPAAESADDDILRDCFDRCLASLPADGRSIVLQYYEGERHAKISNRRHLAAALGLSDGALRNRVLRVRDRLELCVRGCVSAAG